jgi:hypothetical protein
MLRLMSTGSHPKDHPTSEREAVQLRALNEELRRLLEKHQWSGITPTNSYGACPECGGSRAPFAEGHRAGCAIAAILTASS